MFDYSSLFRSDLPTPALKWSGFPKYNFIGGHNAPENVPVEELRAAADRVIRREGRTLATYGLESGSLGYRPLRDFLVGKLARHAGITCTADEILITSGSLQGIDLVNQILLAPGDTVIVEQATYGGTLTRLQRCGAKTAGVPLDDGGMRMDALAATLEKLAAKGVRPKYIYTIPTVQNPTGSIMSAERRAELLRIAAAHGVQIFEDECYSDLVWAGNRPQALRGMSRDGSVIHIGSFSKSIAPALRVGYVVAGWDVLSRMLAVKTDAGSGALEQMVLAEYCREHFDRHVGALTGALRAKLDVLVEALAEQFGTAAEIDHPQGGIFLWLRLPDAVDTTKLAQTAAKEGVAFNPGAEWATDTEWGRKRLRLCFANPPPQTIRDGVAKLAEICHREFGVPLRGANAERAAAG
jgi:2-aminoadipate transaminase